MQQIQTIMTDMKELIIQKVAHPYLLKYIQTPYIDEDKLILIISILDHNGLSKSEMEDISVTTMLIQTALDTHEQVSNSTKANEKNNSLKQRQLTVLAGIYYSSLYYKILADTNNLPMIRVLSEGIKDINEHKILLYQKDFDGIESLMSSMMKIESALIKKLTTYFHDSVWDELSTNFLFIKRLMHEKKTFMKDGSSLLFEALRKIEFPKLERHMELKSEQKQNLLSICDRYIQNSNKVIEEGVQKIPSLNVTVKNRFTNLLLQQQNPIAKTFVEEG